MRPSTGGQPPSPIVEINPQLSATPAQKSQKSTPKPSADTSATSARVNPDAEELDDEDVDYLEVERAGMQAEEPGTTTHIADSVLTPEAV